MTEKFKSFFEGKHNVLILGYGREGSSTLRFLKKYFPNLCVGIADRNENLWMKETDVKLHVGKDYLQAFKAYDLIFKSPGVVLGNRYAEMAEKFTSQTDLFLQVFGKQTIGITGTKGKSTIATLVYHLIKSSGEDAVLVGNVGVPALDLLEHIHEKTKIVYELSAHQLEHVHHSPHIAALINLFPEHLDYFMDEKAYRAAKLNIFKYQDENDIAVCGMPIETGRPTYTMKSVQEELKDLLGANIQGTELLGMAHLRGQHNLGNILLALRVVQLTGISARDSYRHLFTFQPLPHRLELIGNYGGIEFYNDSISTVPQSTLAAVESLKHLDALILGGYDRGLNYSEFIDSLKETGINYFFFLGKAGKRMFDIFQKAKTNKKLFVVNRLEDIFEILDKTPQIKSCLLSPAAASYDQFYNFEHRGDHFRMLAKDFKKNKKIKD